MNTVHFFVCFRIKIAYLSLRSVIWKIANICFFFPFHKLTFTNVRKY